MIAPSRQRVARRPVRAPAGERTLAAFAHGRSTARSPRAQHQRFASGATRCIDAAVKLFLDQPLVGLPDIRRLIALCAIADAHIERAIRLNSVEAFEDAVLTDVETVCKELFPSQAPVVSHTCHAGGSVCRRTVDARAPTREPEHTRPVGHTHNETQDTLDALQLFRAFPYLEQGLTTGRLQQLDTHPGERGWRRTDSWQLYMGTWALQRTRRCEQPGLTPCAPCAAHARACRQRVPLVREQHEPAGHDGDANLPRRLPARAPQVHCAPAGAPIRESGAPRGGGRSSGQRDKLCSSKAHASVRLPLSTGAMCSNASTSSKATPSPSGAWSSHGLRRSRP